MIMSLEQYTIEFTINTSPKVLFYRLSSPGGLSEWFADDVNLQGKIFTFIWDGSEQQAELLLKKDNKYVRFKWLDDEEEDSFFEFKINIDELTRDVALLITDFAEEDEKADAIELWTKQIGNLKRTIGL
ncbi:MAG: SRPBCC domain-containing protein [Bacteroidetes bacterium]|nr:SRPBCC domain-containing protein [Bacteroidota bacterium]MBT6685709.1 SRPBCC domain-containing protein [Bacteroidota bacterium]MBT7143504.1 SRPBCC domain-containing protein [Bacteroidota bacterium]MBT7492229.1 SRPBCC domain-containing protein [Bacteroidota bacterium]